MPNKKIKTELVIFDLWQTLADVKRRPISGIFDFLKLDVDFGVFVNEISKSDIFLKDVDIEKSLGDFLSIFTKDQEIIKKSVKIWKDIAKNSFLYSESTNIIGKLSEKNIRLCLLTNIDKYGFENFSYPELFEYFDYTFLSFREEISKPNLNCWLKIINHFKIKDFSRVIMIGDSLNQDIEPAQKLGLRTILVKDDLSWEKISKNL